MKMTVFGATGPTGLKLVELALDEDWEVKAFVRDAKKLVVRGKKPTEIVTGDVLDAGAVDRAVAGVGVVVVVLGYRPDTSPKVLAQGTANIISAMKRHGVKRLVVQSSYPMSGSAEGMKFLAQMGMEGEKLEPMKPMIDDKIQQENEVRGSGLDWTVVRPLILTDGPRTKIYRVGEKLDVNLSSNISRADVADFILKIIKGNEWVGKTVTVAY